MVSTSKSCSLFLTLWVVGGCATGSVEYAQQPLLVKLKPDPYGRDMLDLIVDAKLDIRHGCVYLVSATGTEDSLAVFPDYYELQFSDGQAVGVRDSHTGRSLKFGVISQFGGGTLEVISPDVVLGSIPAACGGSRAVIYFQPTATGR